MSVYDKLVSWGTNGQLGRGGVLDTQMGQQMAMDNLSFDTDYGTAAPASWQNQMAGLTGMPGGSNADFDPTAMQSATGYTLPDGTKVGGWGSMALGAAQGLAGAYLGMKQYGLAKDSLKEGKRQFNLNYGAQKQTTNTRLEDRQRARVASNPTAYQSVGAYMNQNGIK